MLCNLVVVDKKFSGKYVCNDSSSSSSDANVDKHVDGDLEPLDPIDFMMSTEVVETEEACCSSNKDCSWNELFAHLLLPISLQVLIRIRLYFENGGLLGVFCRVHRGKGRHF